jgi:hypothetical protein
MTRIVSSGTSSVRSTTWTPAPSLSFSFLSLSLSASTKDSFVGKSLITSGSGTEVGSGVDTDPFVCNGTGAGAVSDTDTVANPGVVAAADDWSGKTGAVFETGTTCTVAVTVADASIASIAVGRAGIFIGTWFVGATLSAVGGRIEA